MAEPKQKLSKVRSQNRRNRLHAIIPNGVNCPKCQMLTFRHQVCPNCGYFKGKKWQ